MSSTSAVGRQPVRLPPVATPATSSLSLPPNTTAQPAYAHVSSNDAAESEEAHDTTRVNNWVDRLTDFAQRRTETAAAAAITGVQSIRQGTLTALSLMRTNMPVSTAVSSVQTSSTRRHPNMENSSRHVKANAGKEAASPLTRGVVELTEALSALEARVETDEGYFSDLAEVESCVMAHLRAWRTTSTTTLVSNAATGVSSPRDLGERSGGQRSSGLMENTPNDPSAGLGGGQRVQADLDRVRQCSEVMAQLHAALTSLEDEHKNLQRHYIVEQTFTQELGTCAAQLTELEKAWAKDEEEHEAATAASNGARHRRQRRDGARERNVKEKQPPNSEVRDAVRASLSACHTLLEALRRRAAVVAERLTDELLWMRAEVDRHDWTVVLPATALTKMETITVVPGGMGYCGDNENGVSSARPSADSFLGARGISGDARGRAGRREGEDGREGMSGNGLQHASTRTSLSSSSSSSLSTAFSHSGSRHSGQRRESFLLRVRVPVFASARAPPLPVMDSTSSSPPRFSGSGSTRPSLNHNTSAKARGSIGNDGGGGTAFSELASTPIAEVATVSVVATPARYALAQLFEACRDYLAEMWTRLARLQARRNAEAEQLRRDLGALDTYDPAVEDVTQRIAAVGRYLAALDAAAQEVGGVYQDLHLRVKVPMDTALQTYERFRAQLLEVLKQRLDVEDEEQHPQHLDHRSSSDGDAEDAFSEEEGGEGGVMQHGTPSSRRSGPATDSRDRDADEGAEAPALHSAQRQPRSSASLSQERANRSTQSPQASPSPQHHDLPRASAEFIGMLDTLLRSQERAASEAAAAAPAAVEQPVVSVSDNTTLAQPTLEMEAEDDLATMNMNDRVDDAPHENAAMADTTSSLESPSRLAGRRRPRESVEKEEEPETTTDTQAEVAAQQQMRATTPEGTIIIAATTSAAELPPPTDTTAAPSANEATGHAVATRHTTVVAISSASDVDDVDDDNEDAEGDGVAPTVVEDSASPDSSEDEEVAPSSVNEPRRYGLLGDEGFSGGVRAFFAAVARRVMDFSDSEDDEDGDARGGGGGGGSRVAAPQRKRSRAE